MPAQNTKAAAVPGLDVADLAALGDMSLDDSGQPETTTEESDLSQVAPEPKGSNSKLKGQRAKLPEIAEEPAEPVEEAEPGDEAANDETLTPNDEGAEETPGDEPANPEAETDPEEPDGYTKRIGRLTAEKTELREKLEAAEAEKAELKAKLEGKEPRSAGPGFDLTADDAEFQTASEAVAKTQGTLATVQNLLDQFEDNPDGVVEYLADKGFIAKGADAKAARQFLRNAERSTSAKLTEQTLAVQTRKNAIAQEAATQRKHYAALTQQEHGDWLKDGKSRPAQLYQQAKQVLARFADHPGFELFLADAAYGRFVKEQQAAARKKAAPANGTVATPAKGPAKLAGAVRASGAVTAPKTTTAATKVQRAVRSGSDKDVGAALAELA